MGKYYFDKIENIVKEMTRKELEERVIELTKHIQANTDTNKLDLGGVSKSVCPKCGSNKLYTSITGKLCCTKCVFG
jgi:hypothetical protein